jgi:BirA family biotin operon repressor/biotin-[acetyl-CoA-carboxylase] ligase
LKSSSFNILRRLGDGTFHSGEKIAADFGISRASVWQALQPFGELGVEIFRVPGRGYRLRDPVEWLDRQRIAERLGEQRALFDVEILEQADSTNRVLLQKAALGAPGGSCVVAELQTAGRGRRGRSWLAALGGGLTFSVLWRFEQGAGGLSGLSLAVGVAVLRALRAAGIQDAQLKWPNDIVWSKRKLGGILIEMQGDIGGPCAVVIGIGLNFRLAPAQREQIDQPAVDLATLGGILPSRNHLLADILRQLGDVLGDFGQRGFGALRQEWESSHAHQDQPVLLTLPNGAQATGLARGVSDDGALLLETVQGMKRFISGEVSLRGIAGS